MDFFDKSKSIIENIYFISGPILAFLGFAVIIQLRLTKKAIIVSSRREAAKISATQIEVYSNKIIPMLNNYFNIRTKEKINEIKIDVGEFNREAIEQKIGIEETKKEVSERMKLLYPFLQILNAMEAFSTYFSKGIADEEIAYTALGRTYCHTLETLYFDIATILDKGDSSFGNTISLYHIWSNRLKKEKLGKDKEKILNELSQIPNKKVNPIGTT